VSGCTDRERSPRLSTAAVRGLVRDRPLIPLLILLAGLVVVIELLRPGMVTLTWVTNILRLAVPLAILGACQTLTMLTGGIDLSVGAVASMAGFLTATLISDPGAVPIAIAGAFVAAALAGLVAGVGVGVFRVHPLIMTLGMSLVVLGLANVWQLQKVQTSSGSRMCCGGSGLGRSSTSCPTASWSSSRWPS
jgi:ribose transport system permease protein